MTENEAIEELKSVHMKNARQQWNSTRKCTSENLHLRACLNREKSKHQRSQILRVTDTEIMGFLFTILGFAHAVENAMRLIMKNMITARIADRQ